MAVRSNILQSPIQGIEAKDTLGIDVHVILDCIGYIADFHKVADGFDLLNHESVAGFNICF